MSNSVQYPRTTEELAFLDHGWKEMQHLFHLNRTPTSPEGSLRTVAKLKTTVPNSGAALYWTKAGREAPPSEVYESFQVYEVKGGHWVEIDSAKN